jgi:hypothetical protein
VKVKQALYFPQRQVCLAIDVAPTMHGVVVPRFCCSVRHRRDMSRERRKSRESKGSRRRILSELVFEKDCEVKEEMGKEE